MDDYGVTYVQADIENSPGPQTGTFDLVIMTQVIPHLAWRPDRALLRREHLKEDRGHDRQRE